MMEISGKVIKGQSYGRVLGFPTANLDRRQYARLKQKPKLGVWSGFADVMQARGLPSRRYQAAIVIGPLDKHQLPKIEAHLIGYKGNLYGSYLNIYLNSYLRPFKKFKSELALKRQIKKDIIKARSLK